MVDTNTESISRPRAGGVAPEFARSERWVLEVGRRAQKLTNHWLLGVVLAVVSAALGIFFIAVRYPLGYFFVGMAVAWMILALLYYERRAFYRILDRHGLTATPRPLRPQQPQQQQLQQPQQPQQQQRPPSPRSRNR